MDSASVTSKLKNVIVPVCTMMFLLFTSQAFSQTYQTNGTAVNSGGGLVRMTAAGIGNQTASAWSTTRIDLTQPFDMSFDMFFGCDNGANGGDGMTFALHNDPRGLNALGEGFGYLGYGGAGAITPSIAIEFDTFDGTLSGGGNEVTAPDKDHIAVDVNGDVNQTTYGPNNFTGSLGTLVSKQPILSDRDLEACATNANNYYTIRVTWDATAKVLRLYEEGVLTMTYTRDIVATIFGGTTQVYWGFTGATGSASNEQWIGPAGTIIPWKCSAGTTCCTSYAVSTSGPTTVCSTPITLNVTGPGTISSYSWSNGTTGSSTNVSAPGTYVVSVLQSQAGTLCPSSATFNITSSGPTATISGGGTICNDGVTTTPLSVALSGTGPWTLTYAIDGVAQPIITGIASTPYTIQGKSQHTYTLSSVTNGGGCVGTTSGSSTVNAITGLPVGSDQTFTPTSTVPLSVANTGGTYEWWSAPTGGTLLWTGANYTTPPISAQTTYYVRNAALTSSVTKSISYLNRNDHPAIGSIGSTLTGSPNAVLSVSVVANSSFTLNSVDLDFILTATGTAGSAITFYINSTPFSVPITGYPAGTNSITVPVGYNIVAGTTYTFSYMGTTGGAHSGGTAGTAQGIMYWDYIFNRGSMPGTAVVTDDPEVTITPAAEGRYPGIFNWQITTGSPAFSCARTPITAIPVPPLPVTLLDFTAKLQSAATVFIQWSTAMELNNDYFIVQRSADGINFEDISVVDGNGTNNGILHYHDYDYHALTGISYYRLKQVDFDGQYAYSSVATVSNTGAGVYFNLFPTLCTSGSQVNVIITGAGPNEKIAVTVYDMLARNIYNYTFTTDASGNVVGTLDLPSGILPGTYVAEASFANHVPVREKLIVME